MYEATLSSSAAAAKLPSRRQHSNAPSSSRSSAALIGLAELLVCVVLLIHQLGAIGGATSVCCKLKIHNLFLFQTLHKVPHISCILLVPVPHMCSLVVPIRYEGIVFSLTH